MKAVLLGREFIPYKATLEQKLATDWDIDCLEDFKSPEAKLCFKQTQAVISISYDHDFPPAPELQLLQAPGAGTDRIVPESVPEAAAICNAFGHQVAIAEYCILGMLACAHQLIEIDKRFRAGDWIWSKGREFPTHTEISGKTVCIVGLGKIGLQVCQRAAAMGMRVLGCTRSGRTGAESVAHAGSYEDLRHLAAQSDYIVFCCPLSEATRNIGNSLLFDDLRPTAAIVNVSRGPVLNEHDLFVALRDKKIAAAVLDVWYRYPDDDAPNPRPSDYPFHELDNVVMTPHLSAWTDEMVDRRWSEIASNLDSLALNQPLRNVVRQQTRR